MSSFILLTEKTVAQGITHQNKINMVVLYREQNLYYYYY